MDWDVLKAHETGIIPVRDRAGEEPLEGAQIVNVDLVALGAVTFPITSF